MKKLLFVLSTIFLFSGVLVAQDWRSTYDQVEMICGGVTRVKKEGKFGLVNSDGKEVLQPTYDKLDYYFSANGSKYCRKIFQACANGKCGYMNQAGKIVTPLEYEEVAMNPGLFNNPTAVKKNGKWGFIDTATNRLIIPCIYDSYGRDYSSQDKAHVPYFKSEGGLVILKKGEFAGAVNKTGSVIIPFEYGGLGTSYENDKNEIEGRKLVDGEVYSFFYSQTGEFLRKKKTK